VTINIIRAEMGQHVGTALGRIVAEELEVHHGTRGVGSLDLLLRRSERRVDARVVDQQGTSVPIRDQRGCVILDIAFGYSRCLARTPRHLHQIGRPVSGCSTSSAERPCRRFVVALLLDLRMILRQPAAALGRPAPSTSRRLPNRSVHTREAVTGPSVCSALIRRMIACAASDLRAAASVG